MTEERKIDVMGDEVVFRCLGQLRPPIRCRINEAVKLDKVILVLRK